MADKIDPIVSLLLEPARDGGYVVRSWAGDPYASQIVLAGTLRECLEYMAKHFGAETKTPNLRPVS